MSATASPFGLSPEEAIRWFREKGYALNFDWRDMWGEQHARAFSVAKATRLDLLSDIRESLDKAISEGQTLRQFRKELTPALQEKGWWGKQEMIDPKTGEKKLVQLGSPSRLRTIYETNLRQAMAAGRWERIERTAEQRPYLRYVAIDDGNARDDHLKWHNTVLPWDHPFWKTHAPPNGWGCRCKLQQLSQRDLDRYGYSVSEKAPPIKLVTYENRRTGEVTRVPEGIDPSFDYNPGEVPRGAESGLNIVPLRDLKAWSDLKLAPSDSWPKRPPPDPWPALHSEADIAELRRLFRSTFGVEGPKAATLTDPTGLQLLISEDRLLNHIVERRKGNPTKFKDPNRPRYASRIRETIEDPDEIWMVPHRYPSGPQAGRVVMRMRYFARFEDTGQVVIAHRDPDGWLSWTLYPRDKLDTKREGYLVYRRQ